MSSLRSLSSLTLLLTAAACGHSPGNVQRVTPGTPETLVETCSPCSKDCVFAERKQCIEGKVHSEKAKGGGCLVFCVGEPEKFGKSQWW